MSQYGALCVIRNHGLPLGGAMLLTQGPSQALSASPCSSASIKWLSIYLNWGKLRMVFQCYCWLSYVKRFLRRVIIGAVFRNSLVTNAEFLKFIHFPPVHPSVSSPFPGIEFLPEISSHRRYISFLLHNLLLLSLNHHAKASVKHARSVLRNTLSEHSVMSWGK